MAKKPSPKQKRAQQRTRVTELLEGALASGALVRVVSRHRRADVLEGVVVALSTKWVVLAQLDDGHRPDGWELLRLREVTKVRREHGDLHERVLRARGQWPLPVPADLDLTGARLLLATLVQRQQLVTVHVEGKAPDTMWVGLPRQVADGDLVLDLIDPEGRWQPSSQRFAVRDLTRLTLGDAYVDALATVAAGTPASDRVGRVGLEPTTQGL